MRYISCSDTAKYLRKALKDEFPRIKFSVRSKTYSGGASIDVYWTDGPTSEMVKKITNDFEGATFDSMIDLKENKEGFLDGERVHFGADYIFTNRQYSKDVLETTAKRIARTAGLPVDQIEISQWEHDGTYHCNSFPQTLIDGFQIGLNRPEVYFPNAVIHFLSELYLPQA